jgi:hypothetical protein
LGYTHVRLGEISTYLDHRVVRPGRLDGWWFAVRRGLGACLIILVSEPLYVIPTRMVPARIVVLEYRFCGIIYVSIFVVLVVRTSVVIRELVREIAEYTGVQICAAS